MMKTLKVVENSRTTYYTTAQPGSKEYFEQLEELSKDLPTGQVLLPIKIEGDIKKNA